MLVEMKDICMNFGAVRAVKNVDFTVTQGEIHGLLGENGAGKSTLMNVLGGAFLPTSGSIYIDGKKVVMDSPVTAANHKIRFIHQELNLCNDLMVFENIFLGQELTKAGLLDKHTMIEKTTKVLERMKAEISPIAVVGSLEPAEKQLVEIAKALVFDSRLIIMDEPTTALGQQEIDQLFRIMLDLKEQGVCFIYISHKMPEIFEICDRYTVLRDGEFIACGDIKDIDEKGLTDLMVGKELVDADLKENTDYIKDTVILEAKGLSGKDFYNLDFNLRSGEVLAITGLFGSGVGTLVDTIFGDISPTGGSIMVNGKEMPRRYNIKQAMTHGVAMVPRNRKERGILTHLSIQDNLSMASWNINPDPVVHLKKQRQQYENSKSELDIKAENPKDPITSLSGGNQQKVILGRWLETDADIYLLDNPTQGIDVGAKLEIYKLILRIAEAGKGVIVFSNDFAEIYRVADRCLVLYKGEINIELGRKELTEENMIYYSTGANLEVENHG